MADMDDSFSALFDDENHHEIDGIFSYDDENHDEIDGIFFYDDENHDDVDDIISLSLFDNENHDEIDGIFFYDDENHDDVDDIISYSSLFDNENHDHEIDDFNISSLFDDENHDEIEPVSDSKYTEEFQCQEALMTSSRITSQTTINAASSSSSSSSATTIQELSRAIQSNPLREFPNPTQETQIFCEICVELREPDQMVRNESCDHSFCSDCIAKQVATKIQDKIHIVSCPGLDCNALLELDACGPILPKEVLKRWNEALCEALVLEAQKIYCPFNDCSTVLVMDNEDGDVLRESECPVCHRLFCAWCQVPWHPGVECEEFQRLNQDERGRADLMVKELAKEKNWQRCPRCKFYVEKTEGCLHITCRCQFQFCYGCGAEWTSTHGGCQ